MSENTPYSLKNRILGHLKIALGNFAVVAAGIALLVVWKGESWGEDDVRTAFLHGACAFVILHLIRQILGHQCPDFFGIPSVRQLSRSQGVLIVDRSPWLSHRVAVTVYVLENGIECWLCEGFVLNVQYNELVQISVQADEAENRSEKSLWDTLEKTDKKSILIKPGSYLGGR